VSFGSPRSSHRSLQRRLVLSHRSLPVTSQSRLPGPACHVQSEPQRSDTTCPAPPRISPELIAIVRHIRCFRRSFPMAKCGEQARQLSDIAKSCFPTKTSFPHTHHDKLPALRLQTPSMLHTTIVSRLHPALIIVRLQAIHHPGSAPRKVKFSISSHHA
jgi:hypothetical protein